MADALAVEATEITGADRGATLVQHFALPELTLLPKAAQAPSERDRWAAVLSPRAVNEAAIEKARASADLEVKRRRESGEELRRRADIETLAENNTRIATPQGFWG